MKNFITWKKKHVRIINEDFSSYSLPGKPIYEEEFKAWLKYVQDTPTLSLNEAKQQWEARKKKLQNIIR